MGAEQKAFRMSQRQQGHWHVDWTMAMALPARQDTATEDNIYMGSNQRSLLKENKEHLQNYKEIPYWEIQEYKVKMETLPDIQ